MPLLAAVGFDRHHLGLLMTGALAGAGIGLVAAAWPRIRPLVPVASALLCAVLLLPSRTTDAWVVAAVVVAASVAVLAELTGAPSDETRPRLAAAMAVAGALLLGPAVPSLVVRPSTVVVVAMAAIAGSASVVADRFLRPSTLLVAASLTSIGLFLCDPDTEAATLTGALLVVVAGARVLIDQIPTHRSSQRRTTAGSAAPLAVLLVWVGVQGAAGRTPTIISGYACLGVLLAIPVAVGWLSLIRGADARRLTSPPDAWVVAVQAPLVVVCARLGGVRSTDARAVVVALVALGIATAVLSVGIRRASRAGGN